MSKKRQIDAIERRLADLLTGVLGRTPCEAWADYDDSGEPTGSGVMGDCSIEEFGQWIRAINSAFEIGESNNNTGVTALWTYGAFDYIETAAEHLWEHGVRASTP